MFAAPGSQFKVFLSPLKVVLFSIAVSCYTLLNAQQVLLPTSDEQIRLDHYLNHRISIVVDDTSGHSSLLPPSNYHTAVKPYVNADVRQCYQFADSTQVLFSREIRQWSARWWNHNIYQKPARGEDYLESNIQPGRVTFGIKPIYEIGGGFDLKSSNALLSTVGGVRLGLDCNSKLGVDLRLASGIVTLPNYQDSLAKHFGFVPGWGDRAYMLDSNGRYGFQHLSGNITWRPTPVFNLQIGRDKHFWGDGNRSLFLGDQGSAYPYIKAQTTIWKLQYTSLFAWLQDWTQSNGSKNDFRSKFATFHYLSFNAAKWFNISVFEAIIWQGTDSNRQRWFDPNYLNPMVFFRPVEYSVGSSDNAMLGLAGKIRFNSNNFLYGQIILDEFFLKEIKAWKDGWWGNKQGVQVGYKCFNFGMIDNLFMQMEINTVRPYTYSHGSPQQSYSHGPLPLAHPMGANFAEVMGLLSYHVKGLTLSGQLVGVRYGRDVNDTMNYGQNVFQSYLDRESDFGNKTFQGYATNIFLAKFTTSYVFNTQFPLRLQLTAIARSESTKLINYKLKSSFVMVGLSLPLFRPQDDY
jgi:hypothetical protein